MPPGGFEFVRQSEKSIRDELCRTTWPPDPPPEPPPMWVMPPPREFSPPPPVPPDASMRPACPKTIGPRASRTTDPPPPPAPFSSPAGSKGVVGKEFETIALPPPPPPEPAHGCWSSPWMTAPELVDIVPQKSFVRSLSMNGRGPGIPPRGGEEPLITPIAPPAPSPAGPPYPEKPDSASKPFTCWSGQAFGFA